MNPESVFDPGGAGSCGSSSSDLLNFPTWYKYLDCDANGNPQIDKVTDIWELVAGIIDILLYLGGIVAVLYIVYAGIRFITSQGQPDKIAQARQALIYSAAGLVITILARVVVNYVFRQL